VKANSQAKESFEAHLARLRAEREAKREAMGDMSRGGILKSDHRDAWVFILPDVSGDGAWRVQYFDCNGFSGHTVYNAMEACVDAALAGGFLQRDDEALDRVQNLPSFARGNFAADLIRKLNGREITREQGDALLAEYDAAQGSALDGESFGEEPEPSPGERC